MTTVYVLLRMDEDTTPVFVRSFESDVAADAAREQAYQHLLLPERPEAPGACPEQVAGVAVVLGTVAFKHIGDDDWLTEADSRHLYAASWALYDARKAAYHWWLQANPIDPGAPEGSVYTVVAVEHEGR